MKKILSLLLVLSLMITVLPLSALAEGEATPTETAETEERIPLLDEEGNPVLDEDGNPVYADEEEGPIYPDELRVGHPTITKGDFFTEMFGNDTSDIDVRALIHGYNLVNWDQNQGVYLVDPSVVESHRIVTDDLGNKTYFFVLQEDLQWNDGTPITAWDYAFSLLLLMSPEIEQIGGKIYRAEHLLGYDEYLTGKDPFLRGVGVLDDHQLAITLDHNFLPYFFETGLLLCYPYPIEEIAPGCRVRSDGVVDLGNGYGYGVYITNEDPDAAEPIYTAELLKKTILDPETGYNSHPKKTCGPYNLVDYDYETAHFEINEYFKGAWVYNTLPENFRFDVYDHKGTGSGDLVHYDGPTYIQMEGKDEEGNTYTYYLVKPSIQKISFSVADNDTMAADLASGKFHLVNKVVYGPTILECLGNRTELIEPVPDHEVPEREEEYEAPDVSGIRYQNYPRIGLAFLTFTYDWPTVHEKEVRQAMAWCMDREKLTQEYTSGFGQVVNGYYGIEQWEYLICDGQLEYPINFISDPIHLGDDLAKLLKHRNMYATTEEEFEQMVSAWEMLTLDNLTDYKVDIAKANTILDEAKWTLNRDGEAYNPAVDDVRCKMVDGELVALDLTMMYPRGNHIVDTMQENFLDNLAQVGIKVTLVPEDMEELLKSYYREKERTTDMIYLATNFHVIVDPAITYSTDSTANHEIWNNTYSDDEDLYWRAVNMRKTDPEDVYDYVSKWIAFQERYNEVLPTIPIYSNIYFDFYTHQLQNYYITAHVTWTQAILESYFGEDLEEEDEEAAEAEDATEEAGEGEAIEIED